MNKGFIGVFDSGVGGISVLRELVRLMPEEDYVYFGDSKNAPYGDKSVEEVRSLTLVNIDMLVKKGAKAVVVACNTATSAAVNDLRSIYKDIPVIGIEPAVKPAAEYKDNSVIVVMATDVTLREKKFRNLINDFKDRAEIISVPCHGLAELVEEGKLDCDETRKYLENLLKPYAERVDSVVLGCTHYPFVSDLISDITGAVIFDGGEGTARETKRKLLEYGIKSSGTETGNISFISSDNSGKIVELCKKLLENKK